MKSNREVIRSRRKIILVGQIVLILIIGVVIDKIIKVNAVSSHQDTTVTYENSLDTKEIVKKEMSNRKIHLAKKLKKAENVWFDQENKLLDAEDRYSNMELAEMIMNGDTIRAERTIAVDLYVKKDVEREVKILTAIKEDEAIKARKAQKEFQRIAEEMNIKHATASISAVNNYQYINEYETIKVFPYDTTFKSYMPWTTLSPKYAQGQLLAKAVPDPETAIMTYEGRYLVALGFAYADTVEEKIDIVMEDGTIIPAMVGDFKALEHTDNNNSITIHDGSIVEFIVSSSDEAAKVVKQTGDYNTIFPGKIKEFRKIL